MKMLVAICLLCIANVCTASGIAHKVTRSSDLEAMLGYKLTVQDKCDAWRADGLADACAATNDFSGEYLVRFSMSAGAKPKDVFGLLLRVGDMMSPTIAAPLEMGRRSTSGEIHVEFYIQKKLLANAVFVIRCGNGLRETMYEIQLQTYEPR